MEPPVTDGEFTTEKLEEERDINFAYHCELFDAEVVHKIAQTFLPGLASACVDNTTGGLFKSAGSVAVDMRREMVEYLTQRSQTFVAESIVLNGDADAEVSEHPCEIISVLIDDFVVSKRNFFSRVSGWLLSERREDRIDDFVQEIDLNGFWLLGRREAVAQTLLKNVDFKNLYHCNDKFSSLEELTVHVPLCRFRTIDCSNEGCTTRFPAGHFELHDSTCPFKVLPCEQKCPDAIMRRQMDRHCITVCPMKLVNCPFYTVGCQSTIHQCKIGEHCSESLHSHLLYVLQVIHKETPMDDLELRVEQVEKCSSGQLEGARDIRSLTSRIKAIESKLGPVVSTTKEKVIEELPKSPNDEEASSGSPKKSSESLDLTVTNDEPKSSSKKEELESLTKTEDHKYSITPNDNDTVSSIQQEEPMKSPAKKDEQSELTSLREHTESPHSKEELMRSPATAENSMESPTLEKAPIESDLEKEFHTNSHTKEVETVEPPTKTETAHQQLGNRVHEISSEEH